jgi:hypothetical protein
MLLLPEHDNVRRQEDQISREKMEILRKSGGLQNEDVHLSGSYSQAVSCEEDMIWPVIIKPVKGGNPDEADPEAHEPAMATIEFESSEKMAG